MEQDALCSVVKSVREEAGLSRRELSGRLGMHHTRVGRVESGHRTVDVVDFLDIASAVGRKPSEAFAMLLARIRE